MKSLTEKLAEIKSRAEAVTPVMSMALNKEHLLKLLYQDIAELKTDVPALLAVIEKLICQREVYAERAGDQENYESDNDELAQLLEERTK